MTRIGKLIGTGERFGRPNMLSPIKGDEIEYVNEIRPIGLSPYPASVSDGLHGVEEYDKAGPWVMVGYSLGRVVGARALRAGLAPNCVGAVFVANPVRCQSPGTSTYGIAGQVPIAIPHRDIWIGDDPITSLPDWDGSRSIAQSVTGEPQRFRPGWLNAGAVVASVWRYAVAGRHTAYGTERPRGESRTHIEIARDETYRMAGVNR